MRRRLAVWLALALLAPAAAGAATPRTTLPDVEDEVMCVVCGTALNVSQAPSADQERGYIRARIADGWTKQRIKDGLVEQYGPAVLAEPQSRGFGLAAWMVPVALVPLALLGVAFAARRWRRRAAASEAAGGDGAAAGAGPDLDPADARRLDAELEAFDR